MSDEQKSKEDIGKNIKEQPTATETSIAIFIDKSNDDRIEERSHTLR
ncbi:hypothetical protein KAT63_02985 [Candidatus Parcubacteria bacterium]|nr:hypothetical protein [Candidatus Parcubacteria bacterium]